MELLHAVVPLLCRCCIPVSPAFRTLAYPSMPCARPPACSVFQCVAVFAMGDGPEGDLPLGLIIADLLFATVAHFLQIYVLCCISAYFSKLCACHAVSFKHFQVVVKNLQPEAANPQYARGLPSEEADDSLQTVNPLYGDAKPDAVSPVPSQASSTTSASPMLRGVHNEHATQLLIWYVKACTVTRTVFSIKPQWSRLRLQYHIQKVNSTSDLMGLFITFNTVCIAGAVVLLFLGIVVQPVRPSALPPAPSPFILG